MYKRSLLCFALMLGGCTRHHRIATPARPNPDYLDLAAGWRVRTVTAITRSGRLVADIETEHEDPVKPIRRLFDMPGRMRHVRLLYLIHLSESDHDMAILAAQTPEELSRLTTAVRTAPATACRAERQAVCSWVPRGIGLLAQKPRGSDWVSAP